MRSKDCASAGVCGSDLPLLELRFEATLLVILMKIGEVGGLTALRFGASTTFGRLRFKIGDACLGVGSLGGVGMGGWSVVSVDGRGVFLSDDV
jgi:hypothetical protein